MDATLTHYQPALKKLSTQAGTVILNKEREINLALAALLARGHLLIEDIPGMGKTTLVLTLAKLCGLRFSRIQFTNDLLPADILGNSIFNPQSRQFEFHSGPIFAELVLADELNRATPKTQSACLQAMEERQVTIDGTTHELPSPFFFIATQNPKQHVGTYPLPESQLDRFLMKLEMGYPDRTAERRLLTESPRMEQIRTLSSVLTPRDLVKIQDQIHTVHASDAVLDYLQNLAQASRELAAAEGAGLSPRAVIGYLQAAKAWAYLQGRAHVLPDDLQEIGIAIMGHRMNPNSDLSGKTGQRLAQEVLARVAVD